ncbi:hypothetical protein [Streptomyces sp. NPDC001876]|uniref:hypothetical protein n=1 Tax=Streptomyces sp. NPDC001876 TaxID=3154402 RepID=UPI0033237975
MQPGAVFCSFIEQVCLTQAPERGFTQEFLSRFPDHTEYAEERTRAEEGLALLAAGAAGQGFRAVAPSIRRPRARRVQAQASLVPAGQVESPTPLSTVGWLVELARAVDRH